MAKFHSLRNQMFHDYFYQSMHIDNQRRLSRQELKSLQKIANEKQRGCNVSVHLKKPLKLTKMTHKFYTAPITKFWFYLVSELLVKNIHLWQFKVKGPVM